MSADAVLRAQGLLELGRPADARELIRLHLASAPGDAEALCLYAQCCLRLGDRASLAAAEAAVRSRPDEALPLCLAAYAMAVRRRIGRARAYADAAVALGPLSPATHFTRAQLEVFAVRPSKAGLAAAHEAVRLDPSDSSSHRVLAELLRSRGRTRDAFAPAKEALRLAPNDAAAHATLASLRLRDSRPVVAAEGFARSAAIDPTDQRSMHNLVVVTGVLLARVHVVLLIACFWLIDPDHDAVAVRVSALVGCVAFCLGCWVLGRKLTRALPGRVGSLLRVAVRRDKLLVTWALALTGGFVALLLTGVLPAGPHSAWRWAAVVLIPAVASGIRLVRFLRGRSQPADLV